METFLRGDKIQKGSIGLDALSEDAKVLIGTNGDSPFEKGSVENSAVLKGGDNQVISEGGVALGENNFVGLKGWYINDIYTNDGGKNYIMTISSKNTELGDLVEDSDFNCTYEEGDIISIQIGSIFTNIGRIEIIQEIDCGHYIFFSSLKYFSLPQSDPEKRYYLWVLSKPNAGVVDLGQNGVSYGLNNQSLSECAYTEGKNNKAIGKYAHVEGKENEGHYCSHVEGSNNMALGNTSHAEGTDNRALNSNTHVEGRYTSARGYASHAEGYGESVEVSTEASGEGAHAEGRVTKAQGNYSHTEGQYTSAIGIASHAEGKGESVDNPNLASGNYSHVEGEKTKATNIAAHAEGIITTSSGKAAHAEGRETQSLADYSHAEGYLSSVVSGAIGGHSEGVYNIVNNPAEHASGKYNVSIPKTADNTTADATHFSIGIGSSNTNRKNAFEVKQNGDIYIEGVEGRIQDKLNDTSKEKVFIMPEDFFEENYDEPDENGFVGKIKQEYVTDILENRYTKLLEIQGGNPQVGEFDYFDNYILKLKIRRIEDFSQEIIAEQIQIVKINVNRDSVDFCKFKVQGFTSYFPFAYSMFDEEPENSDGVKRLTFINSVLSDGENLPEENKQFFKKNMGSFADWNAQEGEAGYIENKPFKEERVDGYLKFSYISDIMGYIYAGCKSENRIQLSNAMEIYYLDKYYIESPIVISKSMGYGRHILYDNMNSEIIINIVNYEGEDFIEFIMGDDFGDLRIEYAMYTTLDDKYLPNTLIKTTPQTLSDTDRNQALTNLGIDHIVWKYLCNPIDINPILHSVDLDGNEDILGEKYRPEYYEYEVYKFKPNVCAGMFRQIYHPTKTLGELWDISHINHDEGIVTFSGPGGDEIMFAVIDNGEYIIWHEVDW